MRLILQFGVHTASEGHTGSATGDRPTIAISMGDPAGIGPEVLVAALADERRRKSARFLVHGSDMLMHEAAELLGVHPYWWRARFDPDQLPAGASVHEVLVLEDPPGEGASAGLDTLTRREASAASGASSFEWVERAIACAKRAAEHPLHADGIVTAPINKHAWTLAGRGKWPGHTELLASRLGAKVSRMLFVSPKLKVILTSGHLPLMDLRNVLTIGQVFDTIDLGHRAMVDLGIAMPRIAVCGLNPHAGEHGRFGDEEQRLIEPAIRLAEQQGMRVEGPFPGDTIFNAAVAGRYDLVVAMYHDQGLIPVKLLGFDSAVNCTVGLPTVRTSPDHGTAYDIAWKGKANPGSMAAAIDLAVRMARERRARCAEAKATTRSAREPRA